MQLCYLYFPTKHLEKDKIYPEYLNAFFWEPMPIFNKCHMHSLWILLKTSNNIFNFFATDLQGTESEKLGQQQIKQAVHRTCITAL